MTKYVFTRARKGQEDAKHYEVLRDDAAATQFAVVMGYDAFAEADAEGTPTEFDKPAPIPGEAFDEAFGPTELPEGISGGDYVLTSIRLFQSWAREILAINAGKPWPTGDDEEAFADQAAIVTEDIHRIVIGLRKAGQPASFLRVMGVYVPLVRWLRTGKGDVYAQGPSFIKVRDTLTPEGIMYDVTRTVEVTVPVRALNKTDAINAVKARDLEGLVAEGKVHVYATTARTHV